MTKLRSAPPFSLAVALLLWGWQTGFMVFAIPMIIVIELSHWVSWRWPVSDKEFNAIADYSGIGFFITVIYIFSTEGSNGIFVILSVMPFILFLLMVIQFYSERGKIGLSSLFVSLRRLDPKTSPEAGSMIDLSLPYLLICIISASAGNIRTVWFFILSFILFSLVLWSFRPKRYHYRTWLMFLFLALSISYAGQEGLRDLQRSIESSIAGLFDQFLWRYRDPDRATTAMGTIGRLKQSDRIVLRVKSEEDLDQPLYLREASYSQYNYGIWKNLESKYTTIDPNMEGNWQLLDAESRASVTISNYMPREIGVIPLPHGTTLIQDVAATEINQNQYGTIKMEIREGWIEYKAAFQNVILDSPPQDTDLYLADNYREDFNRLANELDLTNKSDEEKISKIESFFQDNFTYTLTQPRRNPRGKYLQNFLFNTRSGHCEYFATSTVLLLRTLGIPARYVVGYVVDEYSPFEGQYLARSRDSHSWVLAYIANEWRMVDTTPAVWAPQEDESASFMEPIMDIYSWISYRISRYQSKDELEQEETNYALLYLLFPLFIILLWRLFLKERINRIKITSAKLPTLILQGTDSSLYSLIDQLTKTGFVRRKGETLASWLTRVNKSVKIAEIDEALALHYRYRFDPAGDNPGIKDNLARIVNIIMDHKILPAGTENNR